MQCVVLFLGGGEGSWREKKDGEERVKADMRLPFVASRKEKQHARLRERARHMNIYLYIYIYIVSTNEKTGW